jgi:predicted kinase
VHHRPVAAPADLVIPDPCLIVLVGAAGAGKSTFASRHFEPSEILSSDGFRAAIAGDATDQSATRPAFAALHRALADRLAAGRLTVVDATSVRSSDRRALVRHADAAGVPAVAIVLDVPRATVLARNAGRDRVVDPAVIDRHLARLRASLAGSARPIDREGFRTVHVFDDPIQLDRVRVRRIHR